MNLYSTLLSALFLARV